MLDPEISGLSRNLGSQPGPPPVSPASELEFGDWLQRSVAGPDAGQDLALDEVQKNHILRVLKLAGGKVSGKGGAAELLGLKPTTLESRMKKLGIQRTR